MKIRIIIGTTLLSAVVAFFWLDHLFERRALVSGLICLLGLAGWLEVARMARIHSPDAGGGVALFMTGLAATAYLLGVAWWESSHPGAASASGMGLTAAGLACFLFAAFLAVIFHAEHAPALRALLFTLLGVVLFGFLFAYALRLYHHADGLRIGLFFVLGVKGNDIAAYFTGRAIGRHRFLKVSPKKTLEGCAAAVVFSAAWFAGAGLIWPDHFFHWPQAIVLGIIFSLTTQVGDLSQSLVKRACGAKDSAALLPEFGGVIDLIDSTLFSGFFLWSLI
jgi:phosphatidate cytidylyltransferase